MRETRFEEEGPFQGERGNREDTERTGTGSETVLDLIGMISFACIVPWKKSVLGRTEEGERKIRRVSQRDGQIVGFKSWSNAAGLIRCLTPKRTQVFRTGYVPCAPGTQIKWQR